MRLLIATGLYPPDIGGPATYAKLFEERLPAYGIEVAVLPYAVVRHLPPIIRHLAYAWKLFGMEREADLILVQDTVSTGFPAALVSMLRGMRLIVRVPGDYAWEQGTQRFGVKDSLDDFQLRSYGLRIWLLRALQRFVVRRAYKVIAPSMYLAGIVSGWGPRLEDIAVIYNGIKLPSGPATAARQRNHVVSAGRLVPWKGFGELIDVASRHPEWQLSIYGNGPLYSELNERIQKSGTGQRITIETNTTHAGLQEVFKEASVFILNSTYEGMSHTLLEAMAEGAPVIATRVGGNTEVVKDGEDGLLIEPENTEDLERTLSSVMDDMQLRNRLGVAAAKRAKDFSIEKTVETTAALLKSCV